MPIYNQPKRKSCKVNLIRREQPWHLENPGGHHVWGNIGTFVTPGNAGRWYKGNDKKRKDQTEKRRAETPGIATFAKLLRIMTNDGHRSNQLD
jgi:hypothetical protein